MSSPTLISTWYTRANAKFPDTTTTTNINNSLAFMLKELLKGTSVSGTEGTLTRPANTCWTVEGSSDGTTAALDGVDRLTGTLANSYDSSKWVHAASGSAHSWIVLKSPDALGPVWMCIDANSATTTTYGVVFSRQAFAGGGVNGRPLANNAWAAGVSTDPNQSSNVVFTTDQNANSTYRAHMSVNSSGSFNYLVSRDGTGIFHVFLSCFNTVDRNSTDSSFPTFCIFNAVATSRGAPAWATVGTAAANCSGRTVDGANTQTAGGASSWSFGGAAFGGSATPDLGMSNFRTLPIYVQTLTAAKMSWRGRVPDMWIVGNPSVGDSYPSNQSPTQHVVGDVLVPFSVVPIL